MLSGRKIERFYLPSRLAHVKQVNTTKLPLVLTVFIVIDRSRPFLPSLSAFCLHPYCTIYHGAFMFYGSCLPTAAMSLYPCLPSLAIAVDYRSTCTYTYLCSNGQHLAFHSTQVYHKRREQSVDDMYSQSAGGADAGAGADNHFELDFEVRATFDREMTELTAAGLRVQRLVCSPTMQPEMRVQLESRILGDLIIL